VRVLFLSEYCPFDVRTDVFGVFKRMRMLLEAVKGFGDLDVLFFAQLGVDTSPAVARRVEDSIEAAWGLRVNAFIRTQEEAGPQPIRTRLPFWLRSVSRGAVTYDTRLSLNTSHEPSIQALTRCLDRGPDLIFAFRLGSMAPLLQLDRPLAPIFFDLDDAEHVKAMRTAHGLRGLTPRAATYAAVPVLLWSEYRSMALARRTFVSSNRDIERFARFPRSSHRVLVPNAVVIPPPEPPPREPTLLCLGAYLYGPNVEAAEYLIREIWPHVRARRPDARLLIAGAEPERIPSYVAPPAGVEFLGFVHDLAALYRRTRVVCCPIRVGAGTRFKILEAAAYGKPIVSTTVGAEGIEFRDGEEILLRDDPASFAAGCVRVLGDSSLGERLGSAARAVVRQRYAQDVVIGDVRKAISSGLETP
jgi:glycosyltransferase involved in cell wall biosynthesis